MSVIRTGWPTHRFKAARKRRDARKAPQAQPNPTREQRQEQRQ